MRALPNIMVAPNGARRVKSDHAEIPMTDDELVAAAVACAKAGADGIHFHLRNENGRHLLDAERYQVLLDRLAEAVPGMYLQVTSETAGFYGVSEQEAKMVALKPAYGEVGIGGMVRK